MKGSKKEERMMILNMVSEGKISVDESIKLLEALNEPFEDDYFEYSDMEEKLSRFSQSVDNFCREVGDKVGETFKDVEPKIKSATKTVVEKTVNVLGDITQSLNETLKNMENEECQQQEPTDDTPKEN